MRPITLVEMLGPTQILFPTLCFFSTISLAATITTSSTTSSASPPTLPNPPTEHRLSHKNKVIIGVVVPVSLFIILPIFLYILNKYILGRNRATTPPTRPNPAPEFNLQEQIYQHRPTTDPYLPSRSPPPQTTRWPYNNNSLGITAEDPYRQKGRASPVLLRNQTSYYAVQQHPDPYLTSRSPLSQQ